MPRSALWTVLWAEAERMGSMPIDEQALVREQQVIVEEMRILYTTTPYATARDATLAEAAFVRSANRHATIGTAEDVRRARLEDVLARLQIDEETLAGAARYVEAMKHRPPSPALAAGEQEERP